MPFQKGKPRHPAAGRKPGSVNKDQLAVREILHELAVDNGGEFNVVKEIVARFKQVSPEYQIKALISLMPYVYPKLSQIEHRIDGDSNNVVRITQKSFGEYCQAASYPNPYDMQVKMKRFVIDDNEQAPRLLLGSRGYGKTDYTVCMGLGYRIYQDYLSPTPSFTSLLITKSEERNASIIREIALSLSSNGVEVEMQNSRNLRIKGLLGKDHSLSATTVGTVTLRGRHPKLIIMEDVVTPEDVSEATRKKVHRVYDEAYKLCKNIALVGQPVHKFDLYETLRPILKKMEVPWGSIPELDEDIDSMKLAGISEDSISASYLLKVISDGQIAFGDIKYVDTFPMGDAVAFIDPSHEGGDYTALSCVKGHFDGVAVQGHCWKRAWNHCVEEMVDRMVSLNVRRVCFETNALGDQPILMLRQAFSERNVPIGVVGRKSTTNKHSRIMAAAGYAHLIHLSKASDREYQNQVTKYEYKSSPDDAPDSLASALAWIGLIKGKE